MPQPCKSSFFDQIRKRRRSGNDTVKNPRQHRIESNQNASASSWGAADISDSETSSHSDLDRLEDEEDAEQDPGLIGNSSISPPPRKRRHLGSEDVGRFANMSIETDAIRTAPALRIEPTEIIIPQSPKLQPINEKKTAYQADLDDNDRCLEEIGPSFIKEPLDDELEMRNRRGPNTIQLDDDRFLVTSLSDSSSDEEDDIEKIEREKVASILQNAKVEELQEVLGSDPMRENDANENFTINGELISKLQTLEWQQRLGIGRDKAATPLFKPAKESEEEKKNESALILWRQPHNLCLQFGKTNIPATSSNSFQDQEQQVVPPVVIEDGQYAYVQRDSEEGAQVPSVFPPISVSMTSGQEDAMDMD